MIFLYSFLEIKNLQKIAFSSVLVLSASFLNILGSFICGRIGIPLYMDSFATIAIGTVGFLPSIFVAVFTNGILFLFGRLKLVFVLCQVMTAFCASFIFGIAKKHGEKIFPSIVLCSQEF